MVDIADAATPENVQVAKLQADSRKWVAARMTPRRWGDRTAVDVGGQPSNPVTWVELAKKAGASGPPAPTSAGCEHQITATTH